MFGQAACAAGKAWGLWRHHARVPEALLCRRQDLWLMGPSCAAWARWSCLLARSGRPPSRAPDPAPCTHPPSARRTLLSLDQDEFWHSGLTRARRRGMAGGPRGQLGRLHHLAGLHHDGRARLALPLLLCWRLSPLREFPVSGSLAARPLMPRRAERGPVKEGRRTEAAGRRAGGGRGYLCLRRAACGTARRWRTGSTV